MELPDSIPEYTELVEDPDSLNILLMGKNVSNVDTIMFVNINSITRMVTLISIPRDLYVNGRKINSVYANYGVYEQVKWVEEVLGYKIDHYVLIDMYVFRDVIDAMDGVDIVLEEDLIDPYYKTCDAAGNNCSTLYYEAGEHHLNGTEALRVARSRYTTSDYSRAARQQIIIEGLKNKATNLGFGDADSLMSIISSALSSTETDIGLDEAVRYYFKYQNFSMNRGYVLSSGNVLQTVKVPVSYETSLVIETCLDENLPYTCEDTYAIYTLMPRDDNWNAIKWYVDGVL